MAIECDICQKDAQCLDMRDSAYQAQDMSEEYREEASWEWAFIYKRGQSETRTIRNIYLTVNLTTFCVQSYKISYILLLVDIYAQHIYLCFI